MKSCDGFVPDGEAAETMSKSDKISVCYLTTVTWICVCLCELCGD